MSFIVALMKNGKTAEEATIFDRKEITKVLDAEYSKMLDGKEYGLSIQCCAIGATFDHECGFWYCDDCSMRPDMCICKTAKPPQPKKRSLDK